MGTQWPIEVASFSNFDGSRVLLALWEDTVARRVKPTLLRALLIFKRQRMSDLGWRFYGSPNRFWSAVHRMDARFGRRFCWNLGQSLT